MSTPQDKAIAEAEKEFPNIVPGTANELNTARYREGFVRGYLRACEHSPDMVERVIRICKETLNAHGYDFPLDHDTPAMLDFRTHLTSLFKPQP